MAGNRQTAEPQTLDGQRLKVLLVEDNPGDVRLIQEYLTGKAETNFDLETADRLATALRRLSVGGIDAVLLDLALPDSKGKETFSKAKAHAPTVPIIILTGLGDEALALAMVQDGAQDYVAKVELNGSVLSRAIRYAIERERADQQIRKFNLDLEQRVRERTAELEAANQELEAFSASVSHDLRGPLHVIDGYSEMLAENYGAILGSEGKKYIERVRLSVQQMAGIIEDLLKLSRTGREELKIQSVNLNEIVRSVLADSRSAIGERIIDWKIGELSPHDCDPGLIRQVFANLLDNAIKYSRRCELAVIEIGEKVTNGESVIFVRDNGAGFDRKNADKLFGAFQRLHSAEEFEGTGVGLATVRRIVHRHGGRIWAEADVGKGATFYFTLSPGSAPRESSQFKSS